MARPLGIHLAITGLYVIKITLLCFHTKGLWILATEHTSLLCIFVVFTLVSMPYTHDLITNTVCGIPETNVYVLLSALFTSDSYT